MTLHEPVVTNPSSSGITSLASLHQDRLQCQIDCAEANRTPYDIYNAEEAFLASTSPVKNVTSVEVGKQVPGATNLKLIEALNRTVAIDIVSPALSHPQEAEQKRLTMMWRDETAV